MCVCVCVCVCACVSVCVCVCVCVCVSVCVYTLGMPAASLRLPVYVLHIVQVGLTSLILAVQKQHVEIVESLLNADCALNLAENVSIV